MRLPLSVVLLQHARELGRPTATGPLLAHHSLQPHLRVQAWTWAGRGDNEQIERQLEALTSPVLLWNGDGTGESGGTRTAEAIAAAASADDAAREGRHGWSAHDYVVLDGTWQANIGPDASRNPDSDPNSYLNPNPNPNPSANPNPTRTQTRTRPESEPNPNQEARSIYRKGPDGLRACARAALVGGPSRLGLGLGLGLALGLGLG